MFVAAPNSTNCDIKIQETSQYQLTLSLPQLYLDSFIFIDTDVSKPNVFLPNAFWILSKQTNNQSLKPVIDYSKLYKMQMFNF